MSKKFNVLLITADHFPASLIRHSSQRRSNLFQTLIKLTDFMIGNFHDGDEVLAVDGKLVGLPNPESIPTQHNYGFSNQRGSHWPLPPIAPIS